MGTTEKPKPGEWPMTYRQYGMQTADGCLNFGENRQAAINAAKQADAEVVYRSLSQWLPLSDEG
jgi:hypothetical protein